MKKKINMETLMQGLGIKENDIVVIGNETLVCNGKFDLVKVSGNYAQNIPNLILGMVSGKYNYKIYKVTECIEVKSDD
jgi:hypothetical protein